MYKRLLLVVLLAISCLAKDFQKPGPIQTTADAQKWADKTLRKLSLEEKIGQMFLMRGRAEFLNVTSPDYLQLRDQIHRYHIGGVVLTVRTDGPFLLRNQPFEAATFTNRLQGESRLPLIFAADFERGLCTRLNGATVFPHAMAFGATGNPAYVEGFAQIVAQEARAIGVQWNFYPIADVNSNPANPIINTRSFGEDPKMVSEMVTAYIRAARDAGMMTTAKHFPGHGDTESDSHLQLARVGGDLQHLQNIELPPFEQAIAAGVDSVMVAHVTVPTLDPDPGRVASTSPLVIETLLKGQLGFKGLVVPDAMDMNALMRLFVGHDANPSARAAVEAVKAGNDMILIPADLDAAYNGLLNAVRSGEIPETRIDESVRKILVTKATLGLAKARLVNIDALPSLIATPEHVAFGQLVADSAITLVRDNGQVLPLKKPAPANGTSGPALSYQAEQEAGKRVLAVIFSDDVRTDSGRTLERELRARIPDANIIYVDPRIAAGMTPQVMQAVNEAQSVIAAVYLIPTAGKAVRVQGTVQNAIGLADAPADLLRQILANAGPRTVVVAVGTPYVAAEFPEIQTYLCTFSAASISEFSAVKALFGEIPIHGHLPVTIPNIAQRGAGIEKPAVVAPVPPVEGGLLQHAQGK
ncbi:MAG TPA: glycoside hydrolase family 3 N-terminal domain-containing protein [Terriglobales bacterium]|nr:glycoside hydrolase family 3 N-terminal domain-containing protein [Terriglobales bacterium]